VWAAAVNVVNRIAKAVAESVFILASFRSLPKGRPHGTFGSHKRQGRRERTGGPGVGDGSTGMRTRRCETLKKQTMRNPEKTVDRSRFNESRPDIADAIEDDKPHLKEPDWDSIEGAAPATEIVPGDGDTGEGIDKEVQPGVNADGDHPEEDDDNPDQESDEALPGDEEEQAI